MSHYSEPYSDSYSETEYHSCHIWYNAKLENGYNRNKRPQEVSHNFTLTPHVYSSSDKVEIRGKGSAVLIAEDTCEGTGTQDKDSTPLDIDILGNDLDVYLVNFGKTTGEGAGRKTYKKLKSLTAAGDNIHLYVIDCDIKNADNLDCILMRGYPDNENGYLPAEGGILEVYDSELQGNITINGGIQAAFYDCSLFDYDVDSQEFKRIAPITLQDNAEISLVNCSAYDINSEGRNTLSLNTTSIKGNIRAAGTNDDYINAANYREKNGLTMVLAGKNTIATPTRHYGQTPDIMVDAKSVFAIKDDPTEPDVGELTIGAPDNDGGHYYCAAIGGMPAYEDPEPHGLIIIEGGILNAWANTNGAVIGGSVRSEVESDLKFNSDAGRLYIRGGVVNVEAMGGGAAIGGATDGSGGEFTMVQHEPQCGDGYAGRQGDRKDGRQCRNHSAERGESRSGGVLRCIRGGCGDGGFAGSEEGEPGNRRERDDPGIGSSVYGQAGA